MTQPEIDEITKVVNNYRDKKFELFDRRREIEKRHQKGEILVWQKEFSIEQLYQDLFDTEERRKFAEFANKAEKDSEFEKYFRAAHLKAFFNIFIDVQRT